MKKKILSLFIVFCLVTLVSTKTNAQEPFLAEIRMFAGNFAPRGWAFCHGQELAISQYTALFSLLGTMYGGDGRKTFALPDLRGRVALGTGKGTGLTDVKPGVKIGDEAVTVSKTADGSKADAVVQPAIGISYIIALQGVFPSRN
ncbi:MAG: tail fiber protein [Ferruginibacter sp.]